MPPGVGAPTPHPPPARASSSARHTPRAHDQSGVRERPSPYPRTMRGDRVEIVIDAGREPRTYEIVATRNGRRVEISTSRGVVDVTEVTRGGTPVRTARFMANRVLALVEHPADGSATDKDGSTGV